MLSPLDAQKGRLKRELKKKGFPITVETSDGRLALVFPDGRQAFADYDELLSRIEEAPSIDWLMASFDLDEQLAN